MLVRLTIKLLLVAATLVASHEADCHVHEESCDDIDREAAVELMQTQVKLPPRGEASRSHADVVEEEPWSPKVALISTLATGSGNIERILHRYCEAHNKTCGRYPSVSPEFEGHLLLERPNLASVAERYAGRVDVWTIPTTFETDLFEQMMPGAVKVAMFREPRARVLSSYRQYKDARSIVEAVVQLRENNPSIPTCGPCGAAMVKQVPINTFDKLDLVMLTEYYDLSLVMLGRKLGWLTADLLYVHKQQDPFSSEQQSALDTLKSIMASPVEMLSPTGIAFMKGCTGGEEVDLYQKAREAFHRQWIALSTEEQEQVMKDVTRLRSGVHELEDCCRAVAEDAYCTVLYYSNEEWTELVRHGRHVPAGTFQSQCYKQALSAMRSS